jgi:hypothetical protein
VSDALVVARLLEKSSRQPCDGTSESWREGLTQERADPDERSLRSIAVLSLIRRR